MTRKFLIETRFPWDQGGVAFCRRWRSNPSGKCSQERLTRGTVTSAMRRAAHPSGCARCGAGAGCSAIENQSLHIKRHDMGEIAFLVSRLELRVESWGLSALGLFFLYLMVYGSWLMVDGVCSMVHELWFMVYGSWFMLYGLCSMVYGLWFMIYGSCFMFYGSWFTVYGL